jgi:hypothetical protein
MRSAPVVAGHDPVDHRPGHGIGVHDYDDHRVQREAFR